MLIGIIVLYRVFHVSVVLAWVEITRLRESKIFLVNVTHISQMIRMEAAAVLK